jgi:tetratricopeptide (TPR) repeat protein
MKRCPETVASRPECQEREYPESGAYSSVCEDFREDPRRRRSAAQQISGHLSRSLLVAALFAASLAGPACSEKNRPLKRQSTPPAGDARSRPLKIDPDKPGDSEAARAISTAFLQKRAEDALRQRRPADAIQDLEKAFANAPGSPRSAELRLLLGRAHELAEHSEQALAEYEKALALEPGNPVAHYAIALLLQAMRRVDPALAAMQKAISLSPKRLVYRLDLVTLLLAKDDKARADAAFTEYERIRNDVIAQARSGADPQRIEAVMELGTVMSDEIALATLTAVLADASASLRTAAAQAIGASGATAPKVRQTLDEQLAREKDPKVMEAIRAALNALPPSVAPKAPGP